MPINSSKVTSRTMDGSASNKVAAAYLAVPRCWMAAPSLYLKKASTNLQYHHRDQIL